MDKYLLQLKNIVLDKLKDEEVEVILFGSRADNSCSITSDVDIGIIPRGKIKTFKLSLLKEEIENSTIPYKVDIVLFSETSNEFKEKALKNSIIWKN